MLHSILPNSLSGLFDLFIEYQWASWLSNYDFKLKGDSSYPTHLDVF